MRIERLAPSPTGYLHLGHAFSMLKVHQNIQKYNGIIKMRIDDLDYSRCSEIFIKDIIEDINWLNIPISKNIYRQSENHYNYLTELKKLSEIGVVYKCICTRKDIKEVLSAPHINNLRTKKREVYPQTCKNKVLPKKDYCLRINLEKAIQLIDEKDLFFIEEGEGPNGERGMQKFSKNYLIETFGDFVIARKDIKTSYNLSTVFDDDNQKITHVTRGNDLFELSKIQVFLQLLLKKQRNIYNHHKLIKDFKGNKLSKRNMPTSLKEYRKTKSLNDLYKLFNL